MTTCQEPGCGNTAHWLYPPLCREHGEHHETPVIHHEHDLDRTQACTGGLSCVAPHHLHGCFMDDPCPHHDRHPPDPVAPTAARTEVGESPVPAPPAGSGDEHLLIQVADHRLPTGELRHRAYCVCGKWSWLAIGQDDLIGLWRQHEREANAPAPSADPCTELHNALFGLGHNHRMARTAAVIATLAQSAHDDDALEYLRAADPTLHAMVAALLEHYAQAVR